MAEDGLLESTPATGRDEYPSPLCARERALISQRRARAFGKALNDAGDALPDDTVALALSGGGIRSATFCLGVLQSLSREALLRKVDFLSTVSGGGYCGGFLGAMINRPLSDKVSGIEAAEAELANPRSPIVNWMRQNGRYLSPNGGGDTWLAFAVLLRNWIAVQVVLVTMVIAGLAAVVTLRIIIEIRLGYVASEAVIWWSPLWYVSLAFVILALPLGCAYWLVPRINPEKGEAISFRAIVRALALTIVLAFASVLVGRSDMPPAAAEDAWPWLRIVLGGTALLLAVSIMILGVLWIYSLMRGDKKRPERRTRTLLSGFLAQALKFAGGAAAVALIDSLGETLYHIAGGIGYPQVAGLLGAGGAAGLARPLINFAQGTKGKKRVSLPMGVIAGAVAIVIAGILLVVLSACAHMIAGEALLTPGDADAAGRLWSALALLAAALVFSYFMGATIRFANDSSQQALYGARLARAYLGASNPARQKKDCRDVTDPIAGDDPSLDEYAPFAHGGPLHLINLTLNETVAGESQIEHRDRKGLTMAIGPAGISAGVRHHALWRTDGGKIITDCIRPIPLATDYRIFISHSPPADAGGDKTLHKVEPLSLATWVAISGAAAGPGLGALTSIGFSMLLTFFNVRMGYWWDSYIGPRARGDKAASLTLAQHLGRVVAWLFPVQTYLFYELLARFYGPNRRHWYLSDGGHFENLACYELIRRRVPFIIVCDCGQDNAFQFSDAAGLVRKARTDFNAEIRFLNRDELGAWKVDESIRKYFGVPADFTTFPSATDPKPAANGAPRPCAMLARVDYAGQQNPSNQPGSVILFLKPSIIGDEPEDILNYQKANAAFPHETTGDQYFDEAQWEAYRKLGEVIASRLFGAAPATGGSSWSPRNFSRPQGA